jgi:hypothetical protein
VQRAVRQCQLVRRGLRGRLHVQHRLHGRYRVSAADLSQGCVVHRAVQERDGMQSRL